MVDQSTVAPSHARSILPITLFAIDGENRIPAIRATEIYRYKWVLDWSFREWFTHNRDRFELIEGKDYALTRPSDGTEDYHLTLRTASLFARGTTRLSHEVRTHLFDYLTAYVDSAKFRAIASLGFTEYTLSGWRWWTPLPSSDDGFLAKREIRIRADRAIEVAANDPHVDLSYVIANVTNGMPPTPSEAERLFLDRLIYEEISEQERIPARATR